MGWHGDSGTAGVRAAERGRARLPACSPTARRPRSSPAASIRNTASPRARAWSSPASRCRRAAASIASASPIRSPARTYTPEENSRYRAEGLASWYGDDFHGRLTANGEIYDMQAISAAHPTLPMPSYVRVTNLATRKSLIVRVNDRGPYHANREIDLSARAADLLGFRSHGIARVRVEYVGRGAARRHRRPAAGRDLARGPAGARAASWSRRTGSCRTSAVRGAARRCRRNAPTIWATHATASRWRAIRRCARPAMRACWRAKRWRAIRSIRRVADVSPDTETPRYMAARLRAAECARPAVDRGRRRARGGPWARSRRPCRRSAPMRRSVMTARRRFRAAAGFTRPISRSFRTVLEPGILELRRPLICRIGLANSAPDRYI